MTAETLARALGGHREGRGWKARCPAHTDHNPSLGIATGENGRVLVYCYAGCSQSAVIDALRARDLWSAGHADHSETVSVSNDRGAGGRLDEDRRIASAWRIWNATAAIEGTLAETYLRARGITVTVPPCLRFQPALLHRPSGQRLPALVAAVSGPDGEFAGLHRTFIAPCGTRKADVDPQRMALGQIASGAVHLTPAGERLLVGEGLESCLSALQAAGIPTWASLSTSGLRRVVLPTEVQEVVILADGDAPGEDAAQAAGRRWLAEGRRVRIARPPAGSDFNDLLVGHSRRAMEAAA